MTFWTSDCIFDFVERSNDDDDFQDIFAKTESGWIDSCKAFLLVIKEIQGF